MRVVLDTNCLIASLSRRSPYFNVWSSLQTGEYTLCVSNEILDEYEEIISMKANPVIASNVVQTIINCPNVELIDPHFHFHLVREDEDDNKFADCAIVGNATFIVSNDRHFTSVKESIFPTMNVILLQDFSRLLPVSTLL